MSREKEDDEAVNATRREAVPVEIYDQTYNLRSASDSERIKRIAKLVDDRMRDISNQVSTVDTAKIAILAALNIADELEHIRETQLGQSSSRYNRASPRGPKPAPQVSEKRSDSWDYDDIFEPLTGERNVEKLGNRIAARLKSRRMTIREESAPEAEKEGDKV